MSFMQLLAIASIAGLAVLVILSARAKFSRPVPGDTKRSKFDIQSAQEAAALNGLKSAFLDLSREGLLGTVTDDVADPMQTRLGGPIVWPKGQQAPIDANDQPLSMLVHIDLSELPKIDGLPGDGFLQMFIAANDMLGCEFPSKNGQGFVLAYHPAGTEFQAHDLSKAGLEHTPIQNSDVAKSGRSVTWVKAMVAPAPFDYRLEDPYEASDDCTPAVEAAYDVFVDDSTEARGNYDIMLLGHPDFTQSDPREDVKYSGMDNLIGLSSTGGALMWGDAGEACVLLPPEDLIRFDLSKAVYYWDCC